MDQLVMFAHPNRKVVPLVNTTSTTLSIQHHHACEPLLTGRVGVADNDNDRY